MAPCCQEHRSECAALALARAGAALPNRTPERRAPSAERVFTRAVDELERSGVRQLNQRERISNDDAGCEGAALEFGARGDGA